MAKYNIPKSILVLGQKYKVIVDKSKLSNAGAFAELDYLERKIFIDDTLYDHEQITALYHEIGHCIMRRNGVAFSGAVSPEFEEVIVETYAQFIANHFYNIN